MSKTRRGSAFAWAVVDTIAALLLVIYVLIAPPVQHKPAVPTPGYYAIVTSWSPGSDDDVDLYVQDPTSTIVYFASPTSGITHLERDDLGTAVSGTTLLPNGRKIVVRYNGERTVITGIAPGEYTADVMCYQCPERSIKVKIQLWRLHDGVVVTERTVTLTTTGQWKTAFRFTLNAAGQVTNINRLPKNIVYTDQTGYSSSGTGWSQGP